MICLSICPYENGYPWNNPTGIDPISAMIAVNHHMTLPIWDEELIACWDQKPGTPGSLTSKELADVHPKFTHFCALLVHVGRISVTRCEAAQPSNIQRKISTFNVQKFRRLMTPGLPRLAV